MCCGCSCISSGSPTWSCFGGRRIPRHELYLARQWQVTYLVFSFFGDLSRASCGFLSLPW